MIEEWRSIPGFEDYEISRTGAVRVSARMCAGPYGRLQRRAGCVLKERFDANGYRRVTVNHAGRRCHFPLHRLLLTVFVSPPPTPQHEARHLNGDKADNRIENLAWGTKKDNAADRDRHGRTARGTRIPHARLTDSEVLSIRAAGGSQREIGRRFGVSKTQVARIKAMTQRALAAAPEPGT